MKIIRYFLFVITLLLLISCYPSTAPAQNTINEETLTSPPFKTVTPTDVSQYIGMKYPPLPDSMSIGSGAMIWPSTSSTEWSIDVVADRKNIMLWFSQILYHDQNGKAYSQVSDITVLPPVAKDQDIVVSACLFDDVLDPEIVALVKVDEESLQSRYLSNPNIILAWRANQSTGTLDVIPTTGVECYAETFLGLPHE